MLTFISFPQSRVRENHLGKEGGCSLPKAQDLPENLPEDEGCDIFLPTRTEAQPSSLRTLLPAAS